MKAAVAEKEVHPSNGPNRYAKAVTEDSDSNATGATSRVWLYMERVKPKNLAHRWHGQFRVKRKLEKFAYDLELPDRSGYGFYPVVLCHV
ncbi:hypothetical protein PHMEG_00019930 [Phytophthora megakarya]|uniref:Uncharacterized protein n=1 Tax=Phytophthora megakarya TaxID=4795 RepID=A0A225VQR1_9STRA|nr:hypothetical protein PHMEG_00019930 [Phytophthora megakarya]